MDGEPLGETQSQVASGRLREVYPLRHSGGSSGPAAAFSALVTNHGYLDNPTFRGMRQSLMQAFDEIYVLDLHGNVKKKETAPDGSKDENVFDIQQGVAIGIFVKRPGGDGKSLRRCGMRTSRVARGPRRTRRR